MTLPPITFEEALEMRLPGEYVPEFDADLLIATYQRSRDTLATLRDATPKLRRVCEVTALARLLRTRAAMIGTERSTGKA